MKVRHSIYFEQDTYESAVSICKLRNFSSISELINRALEEYLAREAGQTMMKLLSKEMISVVENTILMSERRINHILFKLAVGDAEMKHVMAEYFSLDEGFLEDAHDRSIREVRQTNGILNLAQVMSEAREEKE